MHFLPGIEYLTNYFLPVFLEALMVSFATAFVLLLKQRKIRPVLFQLFFLLSISYSATFIFRHSFYPTAERKELYYSIVQMGFTNKDYMLASRYPEYSKIIDSAYLQKINKNKQSRLVILPENALMELQLYDGELFEQLKYAAVSNNQYIFSYLRHVEDSNVYNMIFLLDPEGKVVGTYKKINIVPFVESFEYTKGNLLNTFNIDGVVVAPLICFDSVFIRNYIRDEKPELYIVSSNDIFAENTVLSMLHEAYSIINARTLGRPLIQVMQNGPSFSISPNGGVTLLADQYEENSENVFSVYNLKSLNRVP
jgi:apolipoprotein N-acyltransferase